MSLFNFGVATEPNDYFADMDDQIWIKDDKGQLILLEDENNENDN